MYQSKKICEMLYLEPESLKYENSLLGSLIIVLKKDITNKIIVIKVNNK